MQASTARAAVIDRALFLMTEISTYLPLQMIVSIVLYFLLQGLKFLNVFSLMKLPPHGLYFATFEIVYYMIMFYFCSSDEKSIIILLNFYKDGHFR